MPEDLRQIQKAAGYITAWLGRFMHNSLSIVIYITLLEILKTKQNTIRIPVSTQSVQDEKKGIKLVVVKTTNWSINNKTDLGPFGPSSSGQHV